ncbi:MAG: SDR family NAD(P)-dependent oxidoreductase [Candidatus Diapherotrites archaeon]|nr:SDR family NAD(P)-dependent oxidoreductase [Candidatus Diapherotrites archaeon]
MKSVITGGAGFIGANLAKRLAEKGESVVVLDNLSRKGSGENAKWIKQEKNVRIQKCDVSKDQKILDMEIAKADRIFHLAGQVAVTTSVQDPRQDFNDNALGTFNVLEAMRTAKSTAPLIFSSTNKVYGGMETIRVVEGKTRYSYADLPNGIPESALLDFHSPYGCSKGSADQYVRDYARIYGLNTVVLRQSCIYGERQFGVEDQGWVAWFAIAAELGKKITVYGNGKQVRDVLYVQDLLDAFEAAAAKTDKTRGKIFNVGGGPKNTLSLLELLDYLEELFGKKIDYSFSGWRPGDQPCYVSDIRRAEQEFGWKPKTSAKEGVARLVEWVKANKGLFA